MPRWDSTAVNLVVPPSGQLDTGWTTGQVAVSSYDNWYKNLVWQWLNWLNGNVWDGNIEFTGNVQVDGTTTMVGNATADGHIYCTTGYYGPAGAAALLPAGATATIGNIDVQTGWVSGEAIYFSSPRGYVIPASQAIPDNATGGAGHGPYEHFDSTTGTMDKWVFHNDTNRLIFPISLPVGAVIFSYGIFLQKTSSSGQTINCKLLATDLTTGSIANPDSANASGGSTSANSPGYVSLSPSNTPSVPAVDFSHSYQLVTWSSGAVDDEDFVLGAGIGYTMPHP